MQKTPLFNALIQHTKQSPFSFHIPGHKSGSVFLPSASNYYKSILPLDVTELPNLDDLHDPTEAIFNAQKLASDLYKVKQTYFLVNGSTVGNLAMIFSVCGQGDKILIQRNSHKSIFHAMELTGATPVFLAPEYETEAHVASYVARETIIEALEQHKDAKAIVLTNPNYYGMAQDLTEIIQVAHTYNIPVLVDEAHGAHFVLGYPFPKSAIVCGADMVVHSAHKTLPAMTMGSFLHFNSELVNQEKVRHYLHILQSSSPSYPIMASLDLARAYVSDIKHENVQVIAQSIENFTEEINRIPSVKTVQSTDGRIHTDLLKITIQSTKNASGFALKQALEGQGIYPELADPFNVVLVCPLAVIQIEEIITRMKQAFQHVPSSETKLTTRQMPIPKIAIAESYANLKEKEKVLLHDSIGRIAAQAVIPYPPGIPIVTKGERIRKEHVEWIRELYEIGTNFQRDELLKEGWIEVF